MSLIFSFPMHRVPPVAAHFSGEHEAEIVIFPGVRIERQDLASRAVNLHEALSGNQIAQERDVR